MIPPLTNTERDRAERAVYRALDAVQVLADMGLGNSTTERVFADLRELENRVREAPQKQRRAKR